MIFTTLNNNTTVLEMDYCQNNPLLKLPVTSQFYLRLLWLMLFKIYVHNSKLSYMFYFLEGELKKSANTIFSFLHYVLKELINNETRKIIIFSDVFGGLNRNYIVLNFLLFISVFHEIRIIQVFLFAGTHIVFVIEILYYFLKN
jgi:hypothetical protein